MNNQKVLESLVDSFYPQGYQSKKRKSKRVKGLRKLFKIKTAFTAQYPRYNARKAVEYPAIIRQLKILVKQGYLSEQKYNGEHILYSFTKKAKRVFGSKSK